MQKSRIESERQQNQMQITKQMVRSGMRNKKRKLAIPWGKTSHNINKGTHITRDTCFPSRGTHITSDMCFLGRKKHITSDMCFPGRGTHLHLHLLS